MSLTKRAIDAGHEAEQKQMEKEQETCGCSFNWDDKFWNYCEKHALQMAENNFEE